jgi:hypothetical protein
VGGCGRAGEDLQQQTRKGCKAAAEFVARTFILEAAMELVRLGAGVRQLIVVEDGDQPAGEGHPGEADGRPGGRLLSSSVGGRRLTER